MSARKSAVNMKEAERLVKMGAENGELMERLSLSPEGVELLLATLLETGRVTQVELDFRSNLNRKFDAVDLRIKEPRRARKTRIHAEAVLADLRSGLSEAELMKKYKISVKGLNSLYGKLVRSGQISPHELNALRCPSLPMPTLAVQSASEERMEADAWDYPSGRPIGEPFLRRHRIGMAAGIGSLIGAVCVITATVVTSGPEKLRELEEYQELTAMGTNTQAEHFVKTLESIRADYENPALVVDHNSETEYRECLKNCGEDSPDPFLTDRALAANCRRECLNKHSRRFEAIRRLYHGEK